MNQFLEDYLFNNAVGLILATVKSPAGTQRYITALTKIAAALTAAIEQLGAQQAAQLAAAVQKERNKPPAPPTPPTGTPTA